MPRIAIAVDDFADTVATFRDVFGMPVVDLSENSVETLGARLAMCVPEGGSNIELMSPADPEAPLSQSLGRFLDRRGQGLFALMLEAPDPDAEAEVLAGRGLDVLPLMAGAGGRDVHPSSTHGVLIRIYPNDSFVGRADGEPQARSVSGIDRVILAVSDARKAAAVYRDGFGLEVSAVALDREAGVLRAMCTPPVGGRIEIVAPELQDRPFARRIASFLEHEREGMYALVLQTENLGATTEALDRAGLRVEHREVGRGALETAVAGARVVVEAIA